MIVYPLHLGVSFYPLLLSFCVQCAYRKVRNLQIDVDKLVGKVSINLLLHKEVSGLHNQRSSQNWLTNQANQVS